MSRTAATVLAVLVGAAGLSGCSSDEDDAAPSPPAPPSSSAPAPTAAPTAAPTTSPSPTAAPSATEDDDPGTPDGETFGLITEFGPDGVLDFDQVDFDQAACDARDELETSDEVATLEICFSNVNPRLRRVTVSPDVRLGTFGPDLRTEDAFDFTYDDLVSSYADPDTSPVLPVRLTVQGGVVVRIDEATITAG